VSFGDYFQRHITKEAKVASHCNAFGAMGAQPIDPVKLYKIEILKHMYQIGDEKAIEEIADRISFRKFVGIEYNEKIPDATTMVKFRNRMANERLFDAAWNLVEKWLAEAGYILKRGHMAIVDATLVKSQTNPPPKTNNKSGENEPAEPKEKGTDWTVKNEKPHFGYKVIYARMRTTLFWMRR